MGDQQRPGGWVDGIGWVARLCDLDREDWCCEFDEEVRDATKVSDWTSPGKDRTPHIVAGWADGSTPEAPKVWDAEQRRSIMGAYHDALDTFRNLVRETLRQVPNGLPAVVDAVAEFMDGMELFDGETCGLLDAARATPAPPVRPQPDTDALRQLALERFTRGDAATQVYAAADEIDRLRAALPHQAERPQPDGRPRQLDYIADEWREHVAAGGSARFSSALAVKLFDYIDSLEATLAAAAALPVRERGDGWGDDSFTDDELLAAIAEMIKLLPDFNFEETLFGRLIMAIDEIVVDRVLPDSYEAWKLPTDLAAPASGVGEPT